MVFAIGWSGLSVASAKTMHMNWQTHNEHLMNKQLMNNHCTDSHSMVEEQTHDHHSQSMQDCHLQLGKISAAHQTDCQSCSTLSCQLSIAWLGLEMPRYQILVYSQENHTLDIPYNAQYPSGYWQEILRPPKV